MDLNQIISIVFICDDALGPPARGLFIGFKNGDFTTCDGDYEIIEFASRLARDSPDVAERIIRELGAAGESANYERNIL